MADNKSSEGKNAIGAIKVDVDCSSAIKGLKALQREAKKTTASLKEVEEIIKGIGEISSRNCKLFAESLTRLGGDK